jgi:hypothetical protein
MPIPTAPLPPPPPHPAAAGTGAAARGGLAPGRRGAGRSGPSSARGGAQAGLGSGRTPAHGRPLPRSGAPEDFGLQEYLFDVKTLAAGGPLYRARVSNPHAVRPVDARAREVPGEYEAHAARLDRDYPPRAPPSRAPAASAASAPAASAGGFPSAAAAPPSPAVPAPAASAPYAVGPLLSALRGYPAVRGIVVGAYGEASADVHHLMQAVSAVGAIRTWERNGARTCAEAQGILACTLRRQWGLTFVREYARLRLARVCYVGARRPVRSSQLSSSSVAAAWTSDLLSSVFSAPAFHAGVRAH